MKKIINLWIIILFGAMLMVVSCETGTEEDPAPKENDEDSTEVIDDDPPPPPSGNTIDADLVTSKILLNNAAKLSGTAPSASPLADLKIDKDTIFLVEGFKNRVRILYPASGIYTGASFIYLQVKGADEYFDIEPQEEESSDSIGVFYIEFDPEDIELPVSFEVEITPHDDNGTPIEPIEITIAVEKKGDHPCSPTNPHNNWNWLWTTLDGTFYAGPNYPVGTVATVKGCCLEGKSVDCITNAIPETEWIPLDYFAYLMTKYENIGFGSDGSMAGVLADITQNIDPSESNFCSGEPSYIYGPSENIFWGDYMYDPSSGELWFTNLESMEREIYLEELDYTVTVYDKFYISEHATYEIISCHFLLETSNLEGMLMERLFERTKKTDEDGNEVPWYD